MEYEDKHKTLPGECTQAYICLCCCDWTLTGTMHGEKGSFYLIGYTVHHGGSRAGTQVWEREGRNWSRGLKEYCLLTHSVLYLSHTVQEHLPKGAEPSLPCQSPIQKIACNQVLYLYFPMVLGDLCERVAWTVKGSQSTGWESLSWDNVPLPTLK